MRHMTAAHPHALNHAHQLALAMGLALSTLVTCAPGSAQAQTSNLTFTGLVVGISDGDTINVLTDQTCEGVKDCRSGKRQHRVRLAEIDAPEVSQPHGASSRRMLSAMVFQKQVGVQQVDTDKYGRVVGQVFEKGRWINAEMVGQGGAWVYRPYARTLKLIELENQARASKLGLWGLQADQITPPWKWRQDKASRKAQASAQRAED